ncbi:MAG TPA: oxidoreductase [Marinilabiliales bacterium]|jgi:ferredoxin--NADP+ reductase/benzoate/toluate 1,2-dioxygenase reductase subunit|nr:MAG: hypothetical protein A2W95_08750 [Bacteroidetes bacterium GWA2_40_14]OFX61791.1 MAG: hypothetical protein A2W84_13790 [Bacteroidetes bacterium GWC2_40_13]OFX75992.1 MAG: hypothetical protein A2W96_00880 [Bacteroidetes bacterium GWD2_40_43]OFX94395.1 MAG: hypothetical protein A2W97_19740 [Bacteroidetes bacterium GWE2_40_63]OFY18873.1 MAG: hypothetical protein A2W88_06510 [Bacteroidetes bacterium GWF2_40_13]OFZ28901.1 MAG: hypothetical protein A2437_13435 [Bacteroidetes bacterium RIFOXYC
MSETYHHSFHKILNVRHLTENTFIVQLERNGLNFIPGQHLVVGKKGDKEFRQYSIYSGLNEPYFEILVREVAKGSVTPKLKKLVPGDELEINGPMGYFTLSEQRRQSHPIVMIATGTGIAPFHSWVSSFRDMNYQMIHGVRKSEEAYGNGAFRKDRFRLCTSQEINGHFHGRVTEYLKKAYFSPDSLFYLCGNSEMIFDAMEILKTKGMNTNNMFAEVYF